MRQLHRAQLATASATPSADKGDDLVLFVFKPHCYDTLFHKHQIPDMECLKFTLSKGLGYGVVLGGWCCRRRVAGCALLRPRRSALYVCTAPHCPVHASQAHQL